MKIMPRYRVFAFHFLDRRTAGIDLDLTAAILAAQQVIIVRFQTGPANLSDAGNAFLSLEPFHIFFVDLPDIAEYLRRHGIVRIIADWLDIDRYARQVIAPFFHPGDDILCQVLGQDCRFKGVFSLGNLFLQLIFGNIEQFGQRIQFSVRYSLFCRDVSNHETGSGTDEDLTIAVIHDTTHGGYGDSPQAVAVCQSMIIAAFKQLQVH